MGLDTKTYWLTDRQSQCNFDFDFGIDFTWVPKFLRNSSVVEEELEVGLWRIKVWLEDFIYV
jgi:hypothetical protein